MVRSGGIWRWHIIKRLQDSDKFFTPHDYDDDDQGERRGKEKIAIKLSILLLFLSLSHVSISHTQLPLSLPPNAVAIFKMSLTICHCNFFHSPSFYLSTWLHDKITKKR
jgi:hypothetical protein